MAEDGKIIYKVVVDDSGVASEAESAGKKAGGSFKESAGAGFNGFKEIATGAARAIGSAFVSMAADAGRAIVDTMKAAVSSVADLEQNVGGVETLFKDSAETVIQNAKRAYETAGLSANEYMETVTSFSASLLQSLGGDTEKAAQYADMAITDMSDNANKMGTDMASIQNAYQGFAKQNYTMLDNLKLGYGGTKSEMERLVEDAEKLSDTFTAQRDENGNLALSYADIVDAIHIVQDNMGITGTTAKEASETIAGSMAAAKAAYDNFLNGSTSGEEFAETIITAAHNIADNVVEIAGSLGKELPGLIQTLAKEIPELARELGPPLFAVAKETLSTLVDMLIDGIPDMLDAGFTLLENLLNGIDAASTAETLTTILKVIGKILESIGEHSPMLVAAGIEACVNLLDGFIQALTGHSTAELWQAFTNFVGEIVQFWKDKFSEWYEIGVSIVEGIKQGIADMWTDLVNSVTSWAGDLWDSVCSFFGVASPSKKFKWLGEMSVEGTELGFEDKQAELTRTVRTVYADAGESAARALQASMSGDFSTAGLARAVSYDINASRMVSNVGGSVYNITVNGIEELDQMLDWFNSREIVGRMA